MARRRTKDERAADVAAVRRQAEQLRAARVAFEKGTEGTAALVARFKRGEKIDPREIIGYLAGYKVFADDLSIPPDFIDVIAQTLYGRGKWARALNEKRKKRVGAEHKAIQTAADRVWSRHPTWGNSQVARTVAPDFPDRSIDWIRKIIKKPSR